MTRRENSRKRRPPFRESRSRLLVVCGGGVTEPEYFAGLKRMYRNPAMRVCVKKKGVDPISLVEYAASVRDGYADTFDEVWCVIDVDQFDIQAAVQRSKVHEIRLAISNPCFEVWLLLHFIECTAAVPSSADAIRRLKRHVPTYCKSELRFALFDAGVEDAMARAQGLSAFGEEHTRNPSSGVWMIAKVILEGL